LAVLKNRRPGGVVLVDDGARRELNFAADVSGVDASA
jgi:hypothetical protein